MAASLQTLVTFLVETTDAAHSVQLLGSWDNFSSPYSMKKDLQKGSKSWSGVFKYSHIICDGDPSQTVDARDGALLMGGTYWYFYKRNDDVEFHDPTQPHTSHCPLLPGQIVNVLEIPVESAPSFDMPVASNTEGKVFTLRPEDRFCNPVPVTHRKRLRSPSSFGNAHRYFIRSRTPRSDFARSKLQTAPEVLTSVTARSALGYVEGFKSLKGGRAIKTSPADVMLPSQTSMTGEKPALYGKFANAGGNLKDGRTAPKSERYQSSKSSIPGLAPQFTPMYEQNDTFSEVYDDYRPYTWAGDTLPMEVGYDTRRAVSEPADYAANVFVQYSNPTIAGQQEFGDAPDSMTSGSKHFEFGEFQFGFEDECELTVSKPESSSAIPFKQRPRLYSLDNVTAFRLSSLQTLFEEKSELTPRQPDRTFSQDSFIWATTSATSSAADSAQSPTYTCPTESVDSPTSCRYFGSSDQSGIDSAEPTRPSSISLDFWLAPKEQQRTPLGLNFDNPKRQTLSTPLSIGHGLDLECARSTETLLCPTHGTTEPSATAQKLEHEALPDIVHEMAYLGPLIF